MEFMCKHEEIVNWANVYVPRFNKLSKVFQTHYYTQSPLDSIHDTVDLMIIGINPKGYFGNGERELTVEESENGSSDLKKELMEEGIRGTLALIEILRPKRIVLLETNAFQVIEETLDSNSDVIEYSSVFSNIKAKVGRIYNIPTISLSHPSKTGGWEVSNKFNSMFVFIHGLAEITNKRDTIKPLKDVVKIMRDEMKLWKERVSL